MPPGEQDTPPCDLQTVQKPQARPWNREGMGLRAHAPILGMLWSGNQSKGRELPLTRLAAVEGEADNHVRSSRRLWTGQLSHSSALKLDGGRMAGPRPASVLQVSGPGLRGGCGKMLPERVPPQVSAAFAVAAAAVATPGLCRRTGAGTRRLSVSGRTLPRPLPPRLPQTPPVPLSLCHGLGSGGAGR